jgi:YVTN family beta-propeller protein
MLVGEGPDGVAVNSVGTRVYVANFKSNTVSVIDTATNRAIATIPVGSQPSGLTVNLAGTYLYVANNAGNTVSVVNTATNTVIATIPVGDTPQGISVNPVGTRVYVANFGNSTVSVIDTATNRVIATIPVGSSPQGVAVNPSGTRVYVANSTSNTVSVIDAATNTGLLSLQVGNQPVAFGSFIGPYTGPIEFLGITTNLSAAAKAGQPVTFTAHVVGPPRLYYKFFYRAGYGTEAYDTNPWLIMQDSSTSSSATFSFPAASNYVVVVWAFSDPDNIPVAVPLIGLNLIVEEP